MAIYALFLKIMPKSSLIFVLNKVIVDISIIESDLIKFSK